MPIRRSSSLASSSVLAVVTKIISMPRIFSAAHDLHARKFLLDDAGVLQGLEVDHRAVLEDFKALDIHSGVIRAKDIGKALLGESSTVTLSPG